MKGRWASKTQHVWVYPVRGLRVLGLGLGDGTRWAPVGIPECAPGRTGARVCDTSVMGEPWAGLLVVYTKPKDGYSVAV